LGRNESPETVDSRRAGRDIAGVSEAAERSRKPTVQALLCVDASDGDRFAGILRHLCVGLVDQAIPLRIVGADPRIESFRLGPVQAVVHPPIAGLTAGRRLNRLLDSLSAQPPTVVHAVSSGSYRTAAAAAKEFEADLVLGVTSLRDAEAVESFRDQRGVVFQAWSQALMGVLERQSRVDRSRIEVVAPGVPAASKAAAFGHPERAATIVSILPREADAGWDRLLRAMGKLIERYTELQLFLIGEGPGEKALRRSVRAKNLSANVAFAPRMGDLSEVLSGADLFVHPSASVAFPANTLQAMGIGLAVVAQADSVSDHLISGETAVLCTEESVETLADAIDGVLRDPAGAREMATTGLEYVRRNHGVSAMAENVAAAYRRLALAQTTFTLPGA